MTNYTQEDILDKVFNEYRAILDKYYPDIVDSMGYGGANFHCTISRHFRNYKKTPFYYNGELKLVHWTSLSNLSSIINNSEIRLYNLINSEDEEEFTYAGKLLSLTDSQITAIKDRYFTASFCSHDDLDNEFLWKKYGKNYEGVAIVFSFVENREKWKSFFLSNVYYELDLKFADFQNEIEILKTKYNNVPTFMNDIWRFAGFYKKQNYHDEKEVRLACIFPFRHEREYLRYVRKELKIEKGRNRIVSYIPLKLWTDPNSSYLKTLNIVNITTNDTLAFNGPELPQLKIDTIYFGNNCGLSSDEYWKFRIQLLEIFQWRLGYKINLPLNLYP